jgi:hypothetical protein
MTRNPSVRRILKNDYGSLLMLMLIGVVWVLTVAGGIFRALPRRRGGGMIEVDSTMLVIIVVITVVVTVLFGWLAARRISSIKRVIADGPEVKGKIIGIGFVKDRGRVEYEYAYHGETHQAGNAIWKTRETSQLQIGHEITLIIDPEKPSRAFIASLYT